MLVTSETKEEKTAQKQAPAKAKPPAKAPVKPLPQMMEEDVIPSLKAIFEALDDISELELSFHDNRVRFVPLYLAKENALYSKPLSRVCNFMFVGFA